MLHIQRAISRFVHVATDSINKSEKISKREIKNLKLQDLGQDLDLTPEEQTETKEEPNSVTLASELSSTSIEFIKEMGFVLLAEKLNERFGEVKDSWEQKESDINTNIARETNSLKAEVDKLRSTNAIYEEKLKAQQEKIRDLSADLNGLSTEVENENSQLILQIKDLYAQKFDQEQRFQANLEELESKNAKLQKENIALHSLIKEAHANGRKVLCKQKNNFDSIQQKYSVEKHPVEQSGKPLESDPNFVGVVPKIKEVHLEFAKQVDYIYESIFSKEYPQKIMAEDSDVQFSQEIFDIFSAKSIETIDA